jgi:uncharacterized membrane protein
MPSTPTNLLLFFGRLHPLLVHLPIGFLTILAIVEVAARFKRFKAAAAAREVILFVTVISAIITVTCGLMLSSAGGYDPSLLFWHKWLGILLACGIIAAAWACWKKRPRWYGGFLIVTLLILAPASHFGGSMTHGKNYLMAYAPAWLRGDSDVPVQTATVQKPITDAVSAHVYSDLVQPIFQQNCLACHNANKSSGQLRLDSLASVNHGGKTGPVIVANHSANSLIVQLVLLPVSDPRHMPPPGKPQPSDDQIELLRCLIDAGAADGKTVAELNPSTDQIELVSRLLKLPVPAEPGALAPLPLADLQPQINALCSQLGIVVTPVAVDQPWIIVNASLSRSFGDKELSSLSQLNPNVIDLNLSGAHITDAGLSTVAEMTNLVRLRLDRTAITDAGLLQLQKLKKLEYLNLYGTAVTDAGLKNLAALPALRHLYLWKTKVDPTAAAAFAVSKTDSNKIAQIQKQIDRLQAQIAAQHVEVVESIKPTTEPTSKP